MCCVVSMNIKYFKWKQNAGRVFKVNKGADNKTKHLQYNIEVSNNTKVIGG